MGDTNMDKTDDLVDYNELNPITGIVSNAPNKGDEEYPPEDDDWTFDDEQKEQHQAKYGDSIFYESFVPKPPRGLGGEPDFSTPHNLQRLEAKCL